MKYSAPEGFFGYENQVTFHINIDSKWYFYFILKCQFGFFSHQIKTKWHFNLNSLKKNCLHSNAKLKQYFFKKKSLLIKLFFPEV